MDCYESAKDRGQVDELGGATFESTLLKSF